MNLLSIIYVCTCTHKNGAMPVPLSATSLLHVVIHHEHSAMSANIHQKMTQTTGHVLRVKPDKWYCSAKEHTQFQDLIIAKFPPRRLAPKCTPSTCVWECSLPHLGLSFLWIVANSMVVRNEMICLFEFILPINSKGEYFFILVICVLLLWTVTYLCPLLIFLLMDSFFY